MFRKLYNTLRQYFIGNKTYDENHWFQAQLSKNEKMIEKSKINA